MNGSQPVEPVALDDDLAAAVRAEQLLTDEAAKIRGDEELLTPTLFDQLYPLLVEPIPRAYVQTTPAVKGKPYVSTGIRSVQVQVNRLNNVLGPRWWWDVAEYQDGGKLCTVTVFVGNARLRESADNPLRRDGGPGDVVRDVLVSRSCTGGVNQGSTLGNVYKGSYTNAAKRAIALLGPGHEVYSGAIDLDPDVNPDVVAGGGEDVARIGKATAKKLVDRVWPLGDDVKSKLPLAVAHVTGREPGECDTKAHATDSLASLTYGEAERVSTWIDGKEAAAKQEAKKQ